MRLIVPLSFNLAARSVILTCSINVCTAWYRVVGIQGGREATYLGEGGGIYTQGGISPYVPRVVYLSPGVDIRAVRRIPGRKV